MQAACQLAAVLRPAATPAVDVYGRKAKEEAAARVSGKPAATKEEKKEEEEEEDDMDALLSV